MGQLKVTWEKMGPEFTYNVWYARNPDGPWQIHNENLITDSNSSIYTENNEYMVDSLGDNRNYYVKITCNDRYSSWWISYSGLESTDGGEGHDEDAPTPSFGNTYGYKVNVAI